MAQTLIQPTLFPEIPPEYDVLYEKLGIDPNNRGPKKGAPSIGEDTMFTFFPMLHQGVTTPSGIHLKLERRNGIDIFDIDFHILKDGQPIAYIDHEQRANDYPFLHPGVPINIPLCTLTSNAKQLALRRPSKKVQYYKQYPKQSFHLTRRSNYQEAICCYAQDFVYLKLVNQPSMFGPKMPVWKCPRERACFGRQYEHTIEDWILGKLDKEGLL